MLLVAGLGNPGPKYAGNRHNVGFMIVDRLAEKHEASAYRDKFQGLFTKVELARDEVVLLKPMTFMNLSGESVQKAMKFFKVELARVLVVHDELDLPFAESRLKIGGGLAGHNGLKSIAQLCGGNDFPRLRFGVGRPSGRGADYVLSDFTVDERAALPTAIAQAVEMIEAVVSLGPLGAMNAHHGR